MRKLFHKSPFSVFTYREELLNLQDKTIRIMAMTLLSSPAGRVWRFYRDGFREMTVGKTLWAIIIIKLIVMFGILRLFFFPDLLSRDFDTDEQRAAHVRSELTGR